MKESNLFEVINAKLDKRNLIEASAGTGKTYSIAILALRLLLEKTPYQNRHIRINEILMVTFTNYAVAELESRVRAFVRLGYDYSKDNTIDCDDTIKKIIDRSFTDNGKEKTALLLKEAVLMLDETSIMTIHGFCQRTLTEFAFDTGQIFGSKALSTSEFTMLLEDVVNECWRNKISTIEKVLVYKLFDIKFDKQKAIGALKLALSNKNIIHSEEYNNELDEQKKYIDKINALAKKSLEPIENLQADLIKNKSNYIARANKYKSSKGWPDEVFESAESFIKKVQASKTDDVKNEFSDITDIHKESERLKKELSNQKPIFVEKVYQYIIKEGVNKIESIKEENNFFYFDDMIKRVADAVKDSADLCEQLRNKYKAVFVDEFQDTDKDQYEIFNTIFHKDTVLFYIGDPKQSIYAFRRADINTYFKARSEGVDRVLEMNTNFRSSPEMVSALNCFFKPHDDFDTFHYQQSPEGIVYHQVKTPEDKDYKQLSIDNTIQKPLSVFKHDGKDDIPNGVAANVVELLNNGLLIGKDGSESKIKPSDIGILVKDKFGGADIKKALSKFKIPAVTIDENKVLNTREANELLYVLTAVEEIKKNTINRALLSRLTGFKIEDILALNEEQTLTRFKSYQEAWTTNGKGVYVMLMRFMADYNVRSVLLNTTTENGDRIISNVLQLIELLHMVSIRKQFSPIELINWLSASIEGKTEDGDEFEQRMESDENSVKIITIHKSKGLEYNIVFAPYLDLKTEITKNANIVEYRNEKDGDYYFSDKEIYSALYKDEFEPWRQKQVEQENRRLLYVALTRAKYKCYVHTNIGDPKTSMAYFLTGLAQCNHPDLEQLIEQKDKAPLIPFNYKYNNNNNSVAIEYKKCEHFSLDQKNWRKLSYSALNPPHNIVFVGNKKTPENEYDQFVFRDLKRGAKTGNLLHYIFENIDFSSDKNWNRVIEQAIKRIGYSGDELSIENINALLSHTLSATIHTDKDRFSMNQLTTAQRLNELEFDFPVKLFHTDKLKALADEVAVWNIKDLQELEGIMNGKIDLFFEMNGKYYVLDWKSNYLGDSPEDYQIDKLAEAMTENNYNLQYHIYSVAVNKYLNTRLPGFDYERDFGGVIYLFLRGVRADATNGIFFHKPQWHNIEKLNSIFC